MRRRAPPLNNWRFQSAAKVYPKLRNAFGKPSLYVNKRGGIVIWEEKDLLRHSNSHPWARIILEDKAIRHNCPAIHYDCLTFYFRAYLNPDDLRDVHAISGSIGYDPLQKLVWVRCADVAANVVAALLVTRLITKQLTIRDIFTNQLYVNYMKEAFGGGDVLINQFTKEVLSNLIKHWQSTIDTPARWKFAFNEDCSRPIDSQVDTTVERFGNREHSVLLPAGSDVNTINPNSRYGTVEQRRQYPKFRDKLYPMEDFGNREHSVLLPAGSDVNTINPNSRYGTVEQRREYPKFRDKLYPMEGYM